MRKTKTMNDKVSKELALNLIQLTINKHTIERNEYQIFINEIHIMINETKNLKLARQKFTEMCVEFYEKRIADIDSSKKELEEILS